MALCWWFFIVCVWCPVFSHGFWGVSFVFLVNVLFVHICFDGVFSGFWLFFN